MNDVTPVAIGVTASLNDLMASQRRQRMIWPLTPESEGTLMASMPADIAALPAVLRRELKKQCEGDWRRVVIDEDGSATVFNRPQMRRIELPPQTAPKRLVKKVTHVPRAVAPPTRQRTDATTPSRLEVPFQPASVTPTPRPIDTPVAIADDFDANAVIMMEQCRHGLPLETEYALHDNVKSMFGIDFNVMDAAIRNPQGIEIAPETKERGYPILRFRRGDVLVALGFRRITSPMVIAYYVHGMLQGSRHETRHKASNGGVTQQHTRPATTSQMLKRFRDAGATCEVDPMKDTVDVTFEGHHLGKVTIGDHVPRTTIHQDYLRIIRRIKAIQSPT